MVGQLTFAGPGVREYYLGFKPKHLRLTLGQNIYIADPINHTSVGHIDGTRENVVSTFSDDIENFTRFLKGHSVCLYDRVNGTLQAVVVADKVTFTATGFRINITKATPHFPVFAEAI